MKKGVLIKRHVTNNFFCKFTCCISTEARLLLIRRNKDVFLRLSLSFFCFFCRCKLRFANLLWPGSRFRPPAWMEVCARGVALKLTCSAPPSSNCRTCVWYSPCTASPFTCVIKSAGRNPASNAGLPSSTAYKDSF